MGWSQQLVMFFFILYVCIVNHDSCEPTSKLKMLSCLATWVCCLELPSDFIIPTRWWAPSPAICRVLSPLLGVITPCMTSRAARLVWYRVASSPIWPEQGQFFLLFISSPWGDLLPLTKKEPLGVMMMMMTMVMMTTMMMTTVITSTSVTIFYLSPTQIPGVFLSWICLSWFFTDSPMGSITIVHQQ